MQRVELYGTAACPYTREMREHLQWTRVAFTYYDVDANLEARAAARLDGQPAGGSGPGGRRRGDGSRLARTKLRRVIRSGSRPMISLPLNDGPPDGTSWSGEFFAGSVEEGFDRVAHLHPARLPGGDAASRFPAQAAAGFLAELDVTPDLIAPPFALPRRYLSARALVASGVRCFGTTSVGRLFDTAAALFGFPGPVSYEGQAAIWLEHLARTSCAQRGYSMPFDGRRLDWRPALHELIADRRRGSDRADVARCFQAGLAHGTAAAAIALSRRHGVDTVAISGGVFQNRLLLTELVALLAEARFRVLTHRRVPPNDGGISLGQAALAALHG